MEIVTLLNLKKIKFTLKKNVFFFLQIKIGFNSATKNTDESQKDEVSFLLFPSKQIFEMFKNLDEVFEFIVENELSDYFDNMPEIKVIEHIQMLVKSLMDCF